MKPIILTALFLALHTPTQAGAPWTPENIWLESTWQVLNVVDWGQTHYISETPGRREVNPILGRHPNRNQVGVFFATLAGLHWAISYSVSARTRLRWQWLTIGGKGHAVWRNWLVGVKFKF